MTASDTERKIATRRRRRIAVIIMLLCFYMVGSKSAIAASLFDEYRVKAVFLYNLAQFVKWPETAFQSTSSAFTIGILGPDPFDGEVARVIKNETLHSRKVNLIYYNDINTLAQQPCQILFVNINEQQLLESLFKQLDGTPVLTVSDQNGFAQWGGMINMYTTKNRIQLKINIGNTRRTGLQISAKLLSLAHLVDSNR